MIKHILLIQLRNLQNKSFDNTFYKVYITNNREKDIF